MNKNISVIIPTYNDEKTLCATVDSVLNQTRPADEIIIVDDASDINVDKLLGHRSRNLRIIRHNTNQGAGATRNTGIPEAIGDYILFLDSDDIIYPEFLSVTSQLLNDNSQAAVCFADFHRQYQSDNKNNLQTPFEVSALEFKKISAETALTYYLNNTGNVLLSFMLIRKSALVDFCEEYGAFHPKLETNQDFHWFVRLFLKYDSVCIKNQMGSYLIRPNSLSSNELRVWNCRTKALEFLIESKDTHEISEKNHLHFRIMRSAAVRRCARILAGEGNRGLAIKKLVAEYKDNPEIITVVQFVFIFLCINKNFQRYLFDIYYFLRSIKNRNNINQKDVYDIF